ncbi:MAG: SPFH/Band 7/PHB domain protein [Caulobacterales bacterium]|nr:SPFH/Band 7/PHB domain protein [Caulobacterales bacterium]
MSLSLALLALPVAAIAVVIYAGVKIVPQGTCVTLQRFGRYTRTLEPGLHFIVPFVDLIGRKVNLRESVIPVPALDVVTSDNVTLRTDAVIFFRIVDPEKAVYQVEDFADALTNVALANLRAEIGARPLDGLMAKREEIGHSLLSVLDFAAGPWGLTVTRVDLKNLTPPSEVTQATAKQIKAEREKRAEILEAEGAKKAAVLRADGEKEAGARLAEARRQTAAVDAEAREREAAAEVKAARLLSDAMRAGEVDVAALNYFISQKYVAAFAQIAESENRQVVISPADPVRLSPITFKVGDRPDEPVKDSVKAGGARSKLKPKVEEKVALAAAAAETGNGKAGEHLPT